jgi:hypothetical protein
MKTFATFALGTCMTVAFAGAGFAQSSMSNMSSMSAADKATMTKCQGMSASAMQQDAQCTALLKKYPDAAKSGTTGSSSSDSMSSGTSTTTPPKSK